MKDCFANPSGLSNLLANSDLIHVSSNVSKLPGVSELSHPEVTTRQLIDGNNMNTKDCLMNGGVFSSDYKHLEVSMKFMPVRGEAFTDHPMTIQGEGPKASNLIRSQLSGTFSNLGSPTSMWHHDKSFVQFGSPGKFDGRDTQN